MRHVHDGESEPELQRADLVAHSAAQPRVEVGQRLVEQERSRLEHERPGQRHALLLAARELLGQPRLQTAEPDEGQRFARPRRGRARTMSAGPAGTLSSTVRWGNRA